MTASAGSVDAPKQELALEERAIQRTPARGRARWLRGVGRAGRSQAAPPASPFLTRPPRPPPLRIGGLGLELAERALIDPAEARQVGQAGRPGEALRHLALHQPAELRDAIRPRSVSAGTSSRVVASSATTSAVRGLPFSAAISPKRSPGRHASRASGCPRPREPGRPPRARRA